MPATVFPPQKGPGTFPKRWQEACRETLALFCMLSANRRRGAPMGMTRLRDEIMGDFDSFEGKKRVRAKMLGREDLEHWIDGNNYFSDSKFQYVDRWLRLNMHKSNVAEALNNVIVYKERVFHDVLCSLYARDYDGAVEDSADELLMLKDSIFLSQILRVPRASEMASYARNVSLSDYRQIVMYFRNMTQRNASVTALYMEQPSSSLKTPSFEDATVCFGYLTIIGTDEIGPWHHAVPHMFRSAFPGGYSAGSSVSEMTIRHYEDHFLTDWYPQLCSQNATGYEVTKPPEVQLEGDSGFISHNGVWHFAKSPVDTAGLRDLKKYISSLTNRHLVW